MANSIRKKLLAYAKKKGYEELLPWIKSIANHLWYCSCQCDENGDKLVEMWKSLVSHIQNIHHFEGEHVTKCGHPELDENTVRLKKWLKPGSKAMKAVEAVVLDKRILKDVRHLTKFCHTGGLEVYHSMMLKYASKRQEYKYPTMVSRTQLASLDNNFNINREQKHENLGQPRFAQLCPKTTGRWTVRKVYAAKNYDYRKQMMTMAVMMKAKEENIITEHQKKKNELPKNIASIPAPSKNDLTEAHVSRFKTNE